MKPDTTVIVSVYNEADLLPDTLDALEEAFPGARLVVADDGSTDGSAHVTLQAGAEATLAAEHVLADAGSGIVVLCDGDLGVSARELPALAAAVDAGDCDLAIAAFARRVGGGFGFAVGFSRWATRELGGLDLSAPISGQRAVRAELLPLLIPFAPRFGMETAMNIDAARAGLRVKQVELDLEHRATGRTLHGFVHRARQLIDFVAVYLGRRR
jgi:glycosyltransferase involved in cell wall biosynthesis